MPEHLGGSSVEHRRRPNGKDGVLGVESTVIEESLVLLHSGVKRNIVILHPSTKRVEEKNWVLVALLQKLFSGVVKEKDVTVMEGISELESVDCISLFSFNLLVDLLGGDSVLVHPVVELNFCDESHFGS